MELGCLGLCLTIASDRAFKGALVQENWILQATVVAGELARVGLAGILILAGASKLRFLAEFRRTLASLQIPVAVAPFLAVLLPLGEIAIGGLAVIRPTSMVWIASTSLLAVFTCALVLQLRFGTSRGCGCLGKRSRMTWSAVGRNIGLICWSLALAAGNPDLILVAFTVGIIVMTVPLLVERRTATVPRV
jgi:hypothetical protein